MIDLGRLIAAGVAPSAARNVLAPLLAACARFEIASAQRAGAFVAQCWVETGGFAHFEENLWYTTPERIRAMFSSRVADLEQAARLTRNPQGLANCVYAGRNGNGSTLSGDGWKYRGRGAIQLTGRSNYGDAAVELDRPYVEQPGLVAELPDAFLTAAWYWSVHKLNVLADGIQSDAITRVINGPAMSESALRRQMTQQAVQAFS
jgi:putative chitinase